MTQITDILSKTFCPIDGPFEGEDYHVDEEGYIVVDDPLTAGRICRIVNKKIIDKKLIKLGTKGGAVILGFDELRDVNPVYSDSVGDDRDIKVNVKQGLNGIHFVYVDGRRMPKSYKTLGLAKAYVKKLDRDLKALSNVAGFDDSDD